MFLEFLTELLSVMSTHDEWKLTLRVSLPRVIKGSEVNFILTVNTSQSLHHSEDHFPSNLEVPTSLW